MHIKLNSRKNAAEESAIGKLFSAFDNIIAKEGPSTDPNDKYIKPFYGEEVETFFDSLIRRFKAAVARTRVPQRYIPAFDAYVQFYNMEEKNGAGQSEGNVQFPNNAGFKAATAVRNYFAIMLGNELGGPESSLAIRSYDDVYPMVAVVDKNDPGRNPHLEVKVYSPAGDGNFKIAYKGRNIPDTRIDCPEDANGLEALARGLAGMIKSGRGDGAEEKLVGSLDEPYEIDKIKAYMEKNGWRWFFNDHSQYFEFTKAGKELSGSLVPWCAYVLTKDGKYYVGRSLKDWKKDLKSLGVMESVGESAYEKLEYEKGHKNSKGEDAPWVIRSHADGRILASFPKKDDAEKHLARMKSYADKV
jgi:hypothetical protein